MKGPGKYDRECAVVLKETKACAIGLMVLGGNRGSGFSVTFNPSDPDCPSAMASLPTVLREVADAIEADMKSEPS